MWLNVGSRDDSAAQQTAVVEIDALQAEILTPVVFSLAAKGLTQRQVMSGFTRKGTVSKSSGPGMNVKGKTVPS